jgi:outer membrane immunogenic protein
LQTATLISMFKLGYNVRDRGVPVFRKLATSLVAIAAFGGTAFAADLPSRSEPPVYVPPPPPPIFSWTGVYIGGQIGYEWGQSSTSASTAAGTFGQPGYSANGVTGGAHVGYNYQINHFVVGLEGDVDGSSYQGSGTNNFGTISHSTNIGVDGSVRGRVGFAWDRALFYATGGVAFAGLNNTSVNIANGASDSFNNTQVGWTVGGGVEYAVTNNWSIRAEYRYTDYGNVNEFEANSTGGAATISKHETDNRVQAGFSYKFGEPMLAAPPVVAKY